MSPALASPSQLVAYHQLQAVHREIARRDPAHFASYILKDEAVGSVGLPVQLAPAHLRMHQLISKHERLVLWGHPELGKTSQVSIARTLWELGKNPDLRVLIVSATDEMAKRIGDAICRYIEGRNGSELHQVFPRLRQQRGAPWTGHSLFVERRTTAKDPSVRTCGVLTKGVTGARVDILILDDVLTQVNTYTQHQRDMVFEWIIGALVDRMGAKSRRVLLGQAWHPEDALHRIVQRAGWVGYKLPIRTAHGELTWPERFNEERTSQLERELGPYEFSRKFLCEARSDEGSRFRREWIHKCCLRGDTGDADCEKLARFLNHVPPGCKTYTGVDLATGKKSGDQSAIFTLMVHPNGDREVLDVQVGHWQAPETMSRIEDVHRRFFSIVTVEGSGQQELFNQLLRSSTSVAVKSYFTSAKTFSDPAHGIEAMAVEMANGKWIIPSAGGGQRFVPAVAQWIKEMLYYDPASHPGDILMASHFAVEGSRIQKPKGRVTSLDTLRR
jgi:hypothetical protein